MLSDGCTTNIIVCELCPNSYSVTLIIYLSTMTLYHFNLLSEYGKHLAMQGAVLLTSRKIDANRVFLFQLDGFYIEVYCSLFTPELNRYRTFRSTTQIEPYLENIQIKL